jgi:hypothetical protein
MSPVKRRLTNLWRGQAAAPNPPRLGPSQFTDSMGVTFRQATKISGTVLLPGRYEFRLQDLGTDRNVVEVFKEDSTERVATFTAMLPPKQGRA